MIIAPGLRNPVVPFGLPMTKRIACLLLLAVMAAAVGVFVFVSPWPVTHEAEPPLQPAARRGPPIPPEAAAVLASIREADRGQLAVSEEDGHLLRILAASTRARQALEIGTASGYSAVWIGLGLRETGGRLVTIEYDAGRAAEAAANIRRAGLSDIVTLIAGDAFVEIPKLEGAFDFIFLDAWKQDYKRFFDLVFPRLVPGGLFLAHNVVNKQDDMPDFLPAIREHPELVTVIVTPSGEGVSISYRRR